MAIKMEDALAPLVDEVDARLVQQYEDAIDKLLGNRTWLARNVQPALTDGKGRWWYITHDGPIGEASQRELERRYKLAGWHDVRVQVLSTEPESWSICLHESPQFKVRT